MTKMGQILQEGADRPDTPELAARAAGFAEKYETPMTPEVYWTWFVYATRRNETLNEMLDRAMNMGEPITEAALTDIYHQHLSPRSMSDDLHAIGRTLSSALGEVSDAVESNIKDSSAFSGALRSAKQSLVHGTSKREVSEIITQLHKANQQHIASAQRMQFHLEKNRAQVSKLERELLDVKRAANTDYLTKLANRRRLEEMLEDALFAARHKDQSVAFALGDIDGLQEINTKWGLSAGDNVLKVYANELGKSLTGNQLPARFSGAKFALLLPNTSGQGGVEIAESIRQSFKRIDWVSDDTGDQIGNLTVSFGVTELREGDTRERLIDRADKLLMEAKQAGKDRVVFA